MTSSGLRVVVARNSVDQRLRRGDQRQAVGPALGVAVLDGGLGGFGVRGAFRHCGQQGDHVVEDLGGAFPDLVRGEHGHRVRRGGVAVAGGAAEFGHRVGGDTERVAADGRGGQPGGLERDAVGDGGRAARAAVADAGDDDVAVRGHLFDQLLRRGRGEVDLGPGHRAGGAVPLYEQPADLVKERGGVLLGVHQQADGGAAEAGRGAARGAAARRSSPVGGPGGVEVPVGSGVVPRDGKLAVLLVL